MSTPKCISSAIALMRAQMLLQRRFPAKPLMTDPAHKSLLRPRMCDLDMLVQWFLRRKRFAAIRALHGRITLHMLGLNMVFQIASSPKGFGTSIENALVSSIVALSMFSQSLQFRISPCTSFMIAYVLYTLFLKIQNRNVFCSMPTSMMFQHSIAIMTNEIAMLAAYDCIWHE